MDGSLLFAVFAVLFLVAIIGLLYSIRGRRETTEQIDKVTVATRGYLEALEQGRVFAPVTVPVHLEQGEFPIRHDRATMAEVRRARVGGGLGTRVRVGGFPIYLGGWKSVPSEELREVGTGDLVLTNRRLLFLGAHTLTIPFDRLLTCQQIDAALLVSESRSKRPHVVIPENAGLWCFLVNWAADNRFKDPKLPDGMHLTVSGTAPELLIHVTGRAGAPQSAPSVRSTPASVPNTHRHHRRGLVAVIVVLASLILLVMIMRPSKDEATRLLNEHDEATRLLNAKYSTSGAARDVCQDCSPEHEDATRLLNKKYITSGAEGRSNVGAHSATAQRDVDCKLEDWFPRWQPPSAAERALAVRALADFVRSAEAKVPKDFRPKEIPLEDQIAPGCFLELSKLDLEFVSYAFGPCVIVTAKTDRKTGRVTMAEVAAADYHPWALKDPSCALHDTRASNRRVTAIFRIVLEILKGPYSNMEFRSLLDALVSGLRRDPKLGISEVPTRGGAAAALLHGQGIPEKPLPEQFRDDTQWLLRIVTD
jgi:hypothetical protein